MASVYLVCRDARADSLIGNIALGLQLKEAGTDVAVVFTGESLKAFTGEILMWPPQLNNRPAQMEIAKGGTAMGLEITAEFDRRWIDTDRLIQQAVARGLPLIACPVWTQLLGLDAALPSYLGRVETQAFLADLQSARQVIGGY